MFFWEVVESARRLLLGAVLVVVFPRNELSQIAFGLLVAGIIVAGCVGIKHYNYLSAASRFGFCLDETHSIGLSSTRVEETSKNVRLP